jgi:serine/threonine protein kinase
MLKTSEPLQTRPVSHSEEGVVSPLRAEEIKRASQSPHVLARHAATLIAVQSAIQLDLGAPPRVNDKLGVATFRAAQEDGTPCIVKVYSELYLSPSTSEKRPPEERAREEVSSLRRFAVNNPNSDRAPRLLPPGLLDFGTEELPFCAVVENVISGASLSALAATQPLSFSEQEKICQEFVTLLKELRLANVVHRDINPDHLFWDAEAEKLRIIDFNSAKGEALPSFTNVTGTGVQAWYPLKRIAGDASFTDDIYAGAMSLLCTFSGLDPWDVILHLCQTGVASEKVPDLSVLVKGQISPSLLSLLSKGIHPDDKSRFQTVEEFSDALKLAVGSRAADQATLAATLPLSEDTMREIKSRLLLLMIRSFRPICSELEDPLLHRLAFSVAATGSVAAILLATQLPLHVQLVTIAGMLGGGLVAATAQRSVIEKMREWQETGERDPRNFGSIEPLMKTFIDHTKNVITPIGIAATFSLLSAPFSTDASVILAAIAGQLLVNNSPTFLLKSRVKAFALKVERALSKYPILR